MHHIHVPGASLRKKRTVKKQISAPQQISAPIAQSAPNQHQQQQSQQTLRPDQARPTLPQLADARPLYPSPAVSTTSLNAPRSAHGPPGSENTADYVKRRVSMRIQNLPKDFGDAPAVPSIGANFLSQPPARSEGRGISSIPGEKPSVDLRALQDPNLPADRYVAHLLANSTEQDIRDYQADLSKIKQRTANDLQHSVYQNRNHFIKISQEAERLKGEMRSLRNLMSDLTSTLGQTNAALGINTETVSARKYANRSSVANLEAMWSSHLQELWRRVEGSQKYLPAIPGRHVVHESNRWVELNNATFKPRRRVHLILLNDHLLIAIEKKRTELSPQLDNSRGGRGPPGVTSLVAERCLPLQDIELNDLTSKTAVPGMPANRRASRQPTSNAINIRIGSDSLTYAAMDAENTGNEKTIFLTKARKASSDVRKALHVDLDDGAQEGHASEKKKIRIPGNTRPDASATTARASMLVEVDGRQQNFRWVEGQVDELDIDIALQRHSLAVDRVEHLRRISRVNKNNSVVQELVDGRVAERAGRLAKSIMRGMTEHSSSVTKTKEAVQMLGRLSYEGSASARFLEARSEVVRVRTSQCADTGDLKTYLYQLSYIYFTLIRNTVTIYQACFSPVMASAAVKWAKEHVDAFNAVLVRQTSRLDAAGEERAQVLATAREHAAGLEACGIDFRNLVGRGVDD